MRIWTYGSLALAAVLTVSNALSAEPAPKPGPGPDAFLLIESELAHLPGSEHLITLEVERAQPGAVLRKIAKLSGLTIEVRGTFSTDAVVSASFRNTKTKEVLRWLAQQLPIQFRAEPPNTLRVFVEKPTANVEPS